MTDAEELSEHAQALIAAVEAEVGELSESERDDLIVPAADHVRARLGQAAVRAIVLRSLCVHAGRARGAQLGVLRIEGGTVEGELDLAGLNLDFAISFVGTELGWLVLKDTRLVALDLQGGSAGGIRADRVEIAHDLLMDKGFECRGGVYLRSASIGGDLNCSDSRFIARGERTSSLQLDGIRIGGRLFMRTTDEGEEKNRRFLANHDVNGRNARISGGVLCKGGCFERKLDMARAQVNGNFSLKWASVGGALEVEEGETKERVALRLDAVLVTRDLNLDETKVGGNVLRLRRASVDGSLIFDIERSGPGDPDRKFRVDLKQARVGYLDDQTAKAWPGTEALLEGFSFDAASIPHEENGYARLPNWLDKRLAWLDSQPHGRWSSDPYDRLRASLLSSGEDQAARKVAIEREWKRSAKGGLGQGGRIVNFLYWAVLGYGYRPVRFFAASAAVVLGFFLLYECVFDLQTCNRAVAGLTCGDFAFPDAGVPDFDPLLFSFDAFVPIDVGQTAWTPSNTGIQYAVAAETALGWLFAGLLLGAITGVLRRD